MIARPPWSFRKAATFIGWWLEVIVVVVALPVQGERLAFGEDRMVLGPRQFEFDKGAGAASGSPENAFNKALESHAHARFGLSARALST